MYITCKGLTYAKYVSGGEGAPVVYSDGAIAENLLARIETSFQYAEGQDFADGRRIASKRKMTGCNSSIELADLTSAIKKALLSWKSSGTDLLIGDITPAYVGVGYYIWNEAPVSEEDQWICYWVFKQRYTADSIAVSTSTDSIAYQHQTIQGTGAGVQLESGGDVVFAITNDEPLATEAAAVAWLKSKAGIS